MVFFFFFNVVILCFGFGLGQELIMSPDTTLHSKFSSFGGLYFSTFFF